MLDALLCSSHGCTRLEIAPTIFGDVGCLSFLLRIRSNKEQSGTPTCSSAVPTSGAAATCPQVHAHLTALHCACTIPPFSQVQGLQRLAALLQQLAAKQTAPGGRVSPSAPQATSPPTIAHSLSTAASILSWLVIEAAHLPADQQRVLLRLPLDVASRLSSRFAARTLRLLVSTGN